MPHTVEIDQSGKIGETGKPTVLAFANGKTRTILIPSGVKREMITALRQVGKGDSLYYLIFATALYLLLKDDIDQLNRILIDREYQGKEAMIKEHLLNLLRRAGKPFDSNNIQFHYVTKKSPSHKAAIEVLRRRKAPNHTVTLEELMREFSLENRKDRG